MVCDVDKESPWECSRKVKRMVALAEWRKHHIDSIIHPKRIRARIEWSLTLGIKKIVTRQREIKGYRLFREVRLQILYRLAINLNSELGCGINGDRQKLWGFMLL